MNMEEYLKLKSLFFEVYPDDFKDMDVAVRKQYLRFEAERRAERAYIDAMTRFGITDSENFIPWHELTEEERLKIRTINNAFIVAIGVALAGDDTSGL